MDLYPKIMEKLTVWNYSPELDDSVVPKTITFYSNNKEQSIEKIQIYAGKLLKLSDYGNLFDPEEHFHLIGWAKSVDSEILQENRIEIVDDMDLYAVWSNKHEIKIRARLPDRDDEFVVAARFGETIPSPSIEGYVPGASSIIS